MPSSEIRDSILRLSASNKSLRQVAAEVGVSKSTVSSVLKKEKVADGAIPDFQGISDTDATAFLGAVTENMAQPEPKPTEVKAKAKEDNFLKDLLTKKAPKRQFKEADDPSEKASLIAAITMNVNAFSALLIDIMIPTKEAYLQSLPKKAIGELKVCLKVIEQTRTVANTANMMKNMLFMGAVGMELGTQRFLKMKTQGFAQLLQTQTEIEMILKEIALEKVDDFKRIQRPEMRLATIITMTLLSVDSNNRMRELTETKGQPEPLPEETAERFADL
jgi:hypothetical protein